MQVSWFKTESSLRTHPKIEKLARRLGVSRVVARGLMTGLWAWACDTAPDGNLTSYDAEDIAIAAEWEGKPEDFYSALVEIKLLDRLGSEVHLHDWMDRAEGYKRAQYQAERRLIKKDDESRSARVPDSNLRVPSRGEDGEERRGDQISRSLLSRDTTCSEPNDSASEPALLTYPVVGGGTWVLTKDQAGRWSSLYESVSVLAECKKALAWIEANPSKKKTRKGMTKFLNAWLSRAQDRGGSSPNLPGKQSNIAQLRAKADRMNKVRGGPEIEMKLAGASYEKEMDVE